MTRFRCAVIDEIGSPATRIIDARDRNQAILLLLAEGARPVSIARDAPSLADRLTPHRSGDAVDNVLLPLARLVTAGVPISEAAALIEGDSARRIAAGVPVGEVMADADGLAPWISVALTLSVARDDEPGALVGIVADAATIAERRRVTQAVLVETGMLILVAILLIASLSSVGLVIAAGLAMVAGLVARSPGGPVAGAIAHLRVASFLQIFARLLTVGAQAKDAVRLASADTLSAVMRVRIDAAINDDADVVTPIAEILRLSAIDTAIMLRGDTATGARDVSAHLATLAMDQLNRVARMVRPGALAVVAIVLAQAALR